MAIITARITLPAQQYDETQDQQTVNIPRGTLTHFALEIPAGHAGLTRARCLLNGGLLFPSNQGVWFRGDDLYLAFDENIEIVENGAQLTFQGLNYDLAYSHEFQFYVVIQPAIDYSIYQSLFITGG